MYVFFEKLHCNAIICDKIVSATITFDKTLYHFALLYNFAEKKALLLQQLSDISEHLWLLLHPQKRAYRSGEALICTLKKMLKTLLL
jgi:hypothetical protein